MKYLSNPSVVKGLFTAFLLLAASVARPQSANPDTPSYTMRSGGIERSYKLHLPQGLPQGAPLVVVLHGYGGNNDRLFAAVAPVSGLMLEWLYKADTSDVPVPLFEIHGTADRTSAWEGDLDNKGGWGAYVAVPMAVHYWAAKNKCTGMQTDTIPGRTPENGRKVIAHRFTGGTGGSEVWLYEIVGGKHSWGEQDIDTGEELWKFFSKFVK